MKQEKRMEPTLFQGIRNRIDQLCKEYRASGSNGRVPLLMAAIASYFVDIGISESEYWTEVAFRNPK